jgi:hypothetical protein
MDRDSKLIFERYTSYRNSQMLQEVAALAPAGGSILLAGIASIAASFGLVALSDQIMKLSNTLSLTPKSGALDGDASIKNLISQFNAVALDLNNPEKADFAVEQAALLMQSVPGPLSEFFTAIGKVILDMSNQYRSTGDEEFVRMGQSVINEGFRRMTNAMSGAGVASKEFESFITTFSQISEQLQNVAQSSGTAPNAYQAAQRRLAAQQQSSPSPSPNPSPSPSPTPPQGPSKKDKAMAAVKKGGAIVGRGAVEGGKLAVKGGAELTKLGIKGTAFSLQQLGRIGPIRAINLGVLGVVSYLAYALATGLKSSVDDVTKIVNTGTEGAADAVETTDQAVRGLGSAGSKVGEWVSNSWQWVKSKFTRETTSTTVTPPPEPEEVKVKDDNQAGPVSTDTNKVTPVGTSTNYTQIKFGS